MRKIVSLLLTLLITGVSFAQTSVTDSSGNMTVVKDPRIDLLAGKLSEYNEMMNVRRARTGKGYRLMVLTTSNRAQAMNVRTALMQQFPDHKVYMIFQSPFIKLKVGNYLEKKDAEDMRKQLLNSGIITGNIYLLPETIEVKAEKVDEEEM